MRKALAGILAGTFLAVSLTGCVQARSGAGGNNTEMAKESVQQTETQEGTGQTQPQEMSAEGQEQSAALVLHKVILPEEYFITYEVYDEDGVVRTVSKAADGEGNIYYQAEDGREYLFIREGNTYVFYQNQNGEFVPNEREKYQLFWLEERMEGFDEYLKKAMLTVDQNTEPSGETEVAGRICDVYTISIRFVNFEQSYQIAVDRETHACLENKSEKNISGFHESGDDGFTCIRFDTEAVDLRKEFLEPDRL